MKWAFVCLLLVACSVEGPLLVTKEVPTPKQVVSLDCTSLLTGADMQEACPSAKGEVFFGSETERGCRYVSGANSLNADIQLPEAGVAQTIANIDFIARQTGGPDSALVDVGVPAYYRVQGRESHLYFGKGLYFVDVFSSICTQGELKALAKKIAGRLP